MSKNFYSILCTLFKSEDELLPGCTEFYINCSVSSGNHLRRFTVEKSENFSAIEHEHIYRYNKVIRIRKTGFSFRMSSVFIKLSIINNGKYILKTVFSWDSPFIQSSFSI